MAERLSKAPVLCVDLTGVEQEPPERTLRWNRVNTRGRLQIPSSTSGNSSSDEEEENLNAGPHLQGYNPQVRAMMMRRTGRPNRNMPNGRSVSTRQSRYDTNCKAYGKCGHPEETCIALALHIWVKNHMEVKSEEDMKLVLDNWLERNKKWVRTNKLVSTIVAEHMARTNMPLEQVEAKIDWDVINAPYPSNEDE